MFSFCKNDFLLICCSFQLRPREKAANHYNQALKQKYGAHPQIRRIAQHRHVPTRVYNQQKKQIAIQDKEKRKESNRREHSKPGTVPFIAEREKHVIREHE